MRNLWSAKATTRTSSVEPLTLPKRDSPIAESQESQESQEGESEVGMPTSSPPINSTVPSLGRPDAQGFSTPGAVESEVNETVVDVPPSADALVVTVVPNLEPQRPPTNTVVVAGAPYEGSTTVIVSQTPPMPPQPPPPRRSQSAISNRSAAPSISSAYDICRICHCEGASDAPLISPCCCSGSLKYVHQKCLQQWIKSSQTRSCEVCRFTFIMETKVKPFRKWEKLDISAVERRKILCSVTFHIVAITCVIWSLYVLIDRTAEEIKAGTLDWPFWTKLVVVAIGFTGGLVFMYVQCKMYVQLFRRWQSYNKVIYVQNGPAGGGTLGPGGGKYVASSTGDGNGSALNK